MDPYIKVLSETTKDLALVLRDIVKKRQADIDDFSNLRSSVFIKTTRVPSASNDVLDSDNINNMSYDATTGYLYILGDNAGTLQWRRVQLATW